MHWGTLLGTPEKGEQRMIDGVIVRGLQTETLRNGSNQEIRLELASADRDFIAYVHADQDGWTLSLQSQVDQVMLSVAEVYATVQEAIVAAMLRVQSEAAASPSVGTATPVHSIGDLVKKTIAEAKDGYEHPERH